MRIDGIVIFRVSITIAFSGVNIASASFKRMSLEKLAKKFLLNFKQCVCIHHFLRHKTQAYKARQAQSKKKDSHCFFIFV